MSAAQVISKLTIPQLKALCKEKGLSGYSKLNKAALIEKINAVSSDLSKGKTVSNDSEKSKDEISVETAELRATLPVLITPDFPIIDQNTVVSDLELYAAVPANITLSSLCLEAGRSANSANLTRSLGTPALGAERPASLEVEQPAKKRRLVVANAPPPALETLSTITDARIHSPSVDTVTELFSSLEHRIYQAVRPDSYTAQSLSTSIVSQKGNVQTGQNTFKLPNLPQELSVPKININKNSSHNNRKFKPLRPAVQLDKSTKSVCGAITFVSTNLKTDHVSLQYLEFSPTPEVLLSPITLPPKIAQRKIVKQWALFLSGLSHKERTQCVLVSKMIRYAVHLSAIPRLSTKFCGRRLDKKLQEHSQSMTDMWPYLRIRENEVATRRMIYKESFIAGFYKDFEPISSKLWSSPDNPKQYEVAIRFVMTKLWFAMSISGTQDWAAWLYNVIVDAQEIVKDQIWSITVLPVDSTRTEIYHLLEPTCEVVGLSSESSPTKSAPFGREHLRADWSEYIEQQTTDFSATDSLLAHVKWANYEEYDRGISRLWLKQIAEEGMLGDAKRAVAVRYILACIVGNSVSGAWMTVNDMARQDSSMSTDDSTTNLRGRRPRVGMFLSAHHHVESVHFTTSNGQALHPALAAVQTINREYYILRDNGMQVGCEEDGVGAVWMEIIGCDCRGCSC